MYTNKILIMASILLTLLSCGKTKERVRDNENSTEDIAVNLISVEDRFFDREIQTHGLLATDGDVKLSFKSSGIIKKMYVKEGDRISKGQILAELDLTEINAQMIQVIESYDKAKRDYDRAEKLFKDSVTTLESLENLKTGLKVAKQALDIIDFNVVHSTIKASSNGVVLQKTVNEGEYINPGVPVYEISKEDATGFIIKVYLTVHDWLNISEGDKAYIELDGFYKTKFEGYVKHISNHTDPKTGLYLIEVLLLKTSDRMVVGMFANVLIEPRKQTEYKVIPINCISEGDGNMAYVYIPNGKLVKKVPISIAQIKDGLVYTYSGLEGVDKVIYQGAGFLSEQSIISIKQ